MRTPESLIALVDDGILDSVQRPLMSGKEAHIFLVESGGEQRVAKIYKDSQNRSFQNRADYTEGRKVRNSRDQRAMDSRSKHGRSQNEAAWKSAEVDMIYRLRHAGVRVPVPYNFIDGVLIMELVTDAEGFPAPRLGDVTFTPEEATAVFHRLLAEVVRMLCAGVVHGDLSEFNVLMDENGPVIIDFPQAVDAGSNANARKLLLRDVENLQRFHTKFVPDAPMLPYAQELWDLYSRSALTPDTQLTGKFRTKERAVSTHAVLDLIADAERDEQRRRQNLGLSMRGAGPVEQRAPAMHEVRAARGQERPHEGRTAAPPRATAPREPTARTPAPREHAPRTATAPRELAPRGTGSQRQGAWSEPPVRADRSEHQRRPPHRGDVAQRTERPAPGRVPDRQQAPRNEPPAHTRQAPRNEPPAHVRQAPRYEAPAHARQAPRNEPPAHARQAPRDEPPAHARQGARNERPASHTDRSPFRAWQKQAEERGSSGKAASSGFGVRQPRGHAQASSNEAPLSNQQPPQRGARSQSDERREAPVRRRERDPR
ncbi:MAG: PA4780 family RIO1-like protein kinase [Polyangiales bacterium]